MAKRKAFRLIAFILALTLWASIGLADTLKPFAIPFVGKWQPSTDPLLIEENGFQDVQNLRKSDKGTKLKGVSGHTKINTTAISESYPYIRSGFHFVKDQPQESHVLAVSADSTTPTEYSLFENTTAIPSQGNFGSSIYTFASGASAGYFSPAPQGNVAICNGEESLIWGGDELRTTAFINYDPDNTFKYDYSEALTNKTNASPYTATLYTVTGGIDSDTVLSVDFDNEAVDASDSSHTVTAAAATNNPSYSDSIKVFGTHSTYLDGDDYFSIADHADFDLSDGTFTIDFRYRITDATVDRVVYYQQTDADNYIRIFFDDSESDKLTLSIVSATSEVVNIKTSSLSVGTTYHIEFVEDGDNWYAFVDGDLKNTLTSETDRAANYTGTVYIGDDNNGTAGFKGYIDELRISQTARHTESFEIPSKAYTSGGDIAYFYIGSTRQLQGFKLYVSTANDQTSTMSVLYWSGSDWSECSNVSDGTSSGGVSLAQTGSVTFDSTVGTAKKKVINNMSLYWYKVIVDDTNATALYYVTLDAPIQAVQNIWDAGNSVVAACKFWDDSDSAYDEYTDNVNDTTTVYSLVLDDMTTDDYIVLGFVEPQQGFYWRVSAGKGNSTASTNMTVEYWSGSAWVEVDALDDGTATGTTAVAQTGTISFTAVTEGSEFLKEIGDEVGLYYYKISFEAALDDEVEVYNIQGIPAPKAIGGYERAALFQGRLFLLNEKNGFKNKAIYSAYNSPDIFNGIDSSVLYFGDERAITSAATIYNLFRTTGFEQLIVCKTDETYRVSGDGPDNWEMTRMSDNVGCVSPRSMVVCDLSSIGDSKRNVVLWQSAHGIEKTDGSTIETISDDIKCYWDPNDSRAIPSDRLDDSYAEYDPVFKEYVLLISSGAGQTTHNVELRYSLQYDEWTKIYREDSGGADPFQTAFRVEDTNGKKYLYGSSDDGYVFRDNNGVTWDGNSIEQYVHTKDILLDDQKPFFNFTTVEFMRFVFEDKDGGQSTEYWVDEDGDNMVDGNGNKLLFQVGESISIAHYGDRVLTVDETDEQQVPAYIDFNSGPINTQSVMLGPSLIHSFKISSEIATLTDGMEISGMGLYYRSDDTINAP